MITISPMTQEERSRVTPLALQVYRLRGRGRSALRTAASNLFNILYTILSAVSSASQVGFEPTWL